MGAYGDMGNEAKCETLGLYFSLGASSETPSRVGIWRLTPIGVSFETEASKWMNLAAGTSPLHVMGVDLGGNSHDYTAWDLCSGSWSRGPLLDGHFEWQATRRSLSAPECEHWTMWQCGRKKKDTRQDHWGAGKQRTRSPRPVTSLTVLCSQASWVVISGSHIDSRVQKT